MAFFDPAFLLYGHGRPLRGAVSVPVKRVALRHLGMNTTRLLHSRLVRRGLSYSSIVKLPLVCVMAHESGVSSMNDCRNCQTSAATPAEPDDLSWEVSERKLLPDFQDCVRAD